MLVQASGESIWQNSEKQHVLLGEIEQSFIKNFQDYH